MNFMNVTGEQIAKVADQMREHGHVPCLCKIQGAKVSAPTMKRKTHKLTLTIEIEESAFETGGGVLRDWGGFVMLGVAPDELAERYRDDEKKDDATEERAK